MSKLKGRLMSLLAISWLHEWHETYQQYYFHKAKNKPESVNLHTYRVRYNLPIKENVSVKLQLLRGLFTTPHTAWIVLLYTFDVHRALRTGGAQCMYAVHHSANTTVHVRRTPYIRWLYTSGARILGASNSPDFHNNCPGSAGLGNASK